LWLPSEISKLIESESFGIVATSMPVHLGIRFMTASVAPISFIESYAIDGHRLASDDDMHVSAAIVQANVSCIPVELFESIVGFGGFRKQLFRSHGRNSYM